MASRTVLLKAILLSVAFASISNAREQINVATPSQGLIELPVVVAMRNGFFRREGLEIQRIRIEPEVAVKALVAGEVDFFLGWDASLRAAMSGMPIKVVAATVSRPLHVLVSRPEIGSGQSLKGKTLGVDSFSSSADFLSRVAVRFLGVEPDKDVSIEEIGNSVVRLDALRAGSIHAAAFEAAVAVKAEEEGFKRLVHIGEIIDVPVSGIAVAAARLATHREGIERFIRATLRGVRFFKQNRIAGVRIIESHLKNTPSQAAKTYDSVIRCFTEDGFVSDRSLALSLWRAKEGLQTSNELLLSEVVDWSVLRKISSDRRAIPFWLKRSDP
jgi:NitT/TauT family transport system substrate-binding protein